MKLTNEKRERIINRAVNGTLAKREERIAKESNSLAILVYDRIYPTDIQSLMNKLPDGFLTSASGMYVKGSNKNTETLVLISSRRIAAADSRGYRTPCWTLTEKELSGAISKRIDKFIAEKDQLYRDRELLNKQIKQLVYGLNTFKQLREEWPDGTAYYENIAPALATPNVPAVRGADVTNLILSMSE